VNSSTLGYAVAAAAANVAGAIAVTTRANWSMRALDVLVSVAAGFMIAVALLDVIPESLEIGGSSAAIGVVAGYMLVHLTQHTLASHFHFGEETHSVSAHSGISAFGGLMLHTFMDGVAIATGFAVDQTLGLLIFIAIVLHKVPEGLAISSLFLAAGASRQKALAAATGLGVATIIGAALGSNVAGLAEYGLPVAGGVTLYVAASNLVPEFQRRRSWVLQSAFFGGGALYYATRLFLSSVL
jgi:zinc and cadmium transporter